MAVKMQVVLVFALVVLASFIQAGMAVTVNCYNCSFVEGESTDPTLKTYLDAAKLANDANCKLNGDEYNSAAGITTISCPTGGCTKYNADTTITMESSTSTIKEWLRGCGTPPDECSGDFAVLAAAMKAALNATEVTMSGTVCVCQGEKCNGASHVTLAATWIFLAGILYMFL